MIDKDKEEIKKKGFPWWQKSVKWLSISNISIILYKYIICTNIFIDPTCDTWCQGCQKCCKVSGEKNLVPIIVCFV